MEKLGWTLLLFYLGAIFGSFVNVIIYRLPRGLSLSTPRSHCPHCGHQLAVADNLPLFSFLALRGRCRYCHRPITWRYFIVEAVAGAISLYGIRRYGVSVAGGVFAALNWLMLAIVFIDLEHQIIPDRLLLLGMGLVVLWEALTGFAGYRAALFGAFLCGGLLYLSALVGNWLFKQASLGGGDIKLAGLVGLWLGAPLGSVGLFISFGLASLVGLILIATRRLQLKGHLPYAPFLIAGAWIAQVGGDSLIHWYLILGR